MRHVTWLTAEVRTRISIRHFTGLIAFAAALMATDVAHLCAKTQTATSSSNTNSPKQYGELSLEQWRARLKTLDPAAPQSKEAVPGLIALIRDEDVPDMTRGQAAQTLGRIGRPARDAVPVLIELLDEPERPGSSTFFWAAKAIVLFRAEAKDAAPKLIGVLQDESAPATKREAALEALTFIGSAHPRVVSTLIALLQKSPGNDSSRATEAATFRAHAAESLGMIGSGAQAAVPALSRATDDPFENVRRNAVIALGAMGGQGELAIPALVDALLTDESETVQDEAAISISKTGTRAVSVLEQLLHDASPRVRRRAAGALGRMGPAAKSATNSLVKALEDDDRNVRLTSAEAIWAIAADAETIIPTLVRALADDDRQIQIRASRQLIALGPDARTAIASIKSLASDKRATVRRIAAETLRKIESQKK